MWYYTSQKISKVSLVTAKFALNPFILFLDIGPIIIACS